MTLKGQTHGHAFQKAKTPKWRYLRRWTMLRAVGGQWGYLVTMGKVVCVGENWVIGGW